MFIQTWKQFVKNPASGDKKELTVDLIIDTIGKNRYDPDLMKHFSNQLQGLFDLMDVNCDGYLQEDEFHRMHLQLGMQDAPYARDTFKAIDVNGDGKLSFDEVINAVFDFLFSKDEKSPYALFFGPLVD